MLDFMRKYCEKLKECDSPNDCKAKFGETKPYCKAGVCYTCENDPDCKAVHPDRPICHKNKCYRVNETPTTPDNTPKIQSYGSFKWIILDQADIYRVLGKDEDDYSCPHKNHVSLKSVLVCKSQLDRLLKIGKIDPVGKAVEVDKTKLSAIPQWREKLTSCLPDAFESCDRLVVTCEYYWWQALDWTAHYFVGKTGTPANNPNDPALCPVEWRDKWG